MLSELRLERVTPENVRAACMLKLRAEVTVSYHPYENGPEGFYKRLGFRPTGEYNQDEVVAERILMTTAKAGPAAAGGC